MPSPARTLPGVALALLVAGVPRPAASESGLVLPMPARFGEIPAGTYDQATGKRLGGGFIRVERNGNGQIRMEGETRIEGGAQTRVLAELARTDDGRGLRLLRQESRSLDVNGQPLGVLEVDHVAREGRCTGPPVNGKPPETRTISLSERDRVANIPLNLLFQPIVRGETDELRFQILLCGGGPRVVTAVARVADAPAAASGGRQLVRIRYELSLPKLLAKVVQRWLPDLSFWFDPADAGAWIGHEMPLYSKGPTVLMIREGVTPGLLLTEP